MKNVLMNLYTSVAANPSALGAVAAVGVAIASRFGFHVTPDELTGLAVAFAGAFGHKAHASAKSSQDAAQGGTATLDAGNDVPPAGQS